MRRVPLDRSHRIRRGQPTRQRPPIARAIAQMALAALGLSGDPVHEPVHARDPASHILLLCVNVADDMDPRPQADRAPGPTVDLYAATHTVRSADARICLLSEFRHRILMQRPASPFVISNAVRGTWLGAGTPPSGGPDRRLGAQGLSGGTVMHSAQIIQLGVWVGAARSNHAVPCSSRASLCVRGAAKESGQRTAGSRFTDDGDRGRAGLNRPGPRPGRRGGGDRDEDLSDGEWRAGLGRGPCLHADGGLPASREPAVDEWFGTCEAL
jgi:hypothetical protein